MKNQEVICDSCDANLRIDSFVKSDGTEIKLCEEDVQDKECWNCGEPSLRLRE